MAAKRVVSFHDLAASLDNLDDFGGVDESLLVDDEDYAHRGYAVEDLVPPLDDSDLGIADDDEAEVYKHSSPDLKMILDDAYQPGFLDDSINKRINFYDAMQAAAPNARQISLIEAFDLRAEAEWAKIEKYVHSSSPSRTVPDEVSDPKATDDMNNEAIEAAITAIDINSSIREGPTDLHRAIDALAKAELMNNIEQASSPKKMTDTMDSQPIPESTTEDDAPPDPVDDEQPSTAFDIDETIQTSFIPSTEYYKPLEILTYVGITKSRV